MKKGCTSCRVVVMAWLALWALHYGTEAEAAELYTGALDFTINQPGDVYTWVAKGQGLTTDPLTGVAYTDGGIASSPRLSYTVAVPTAGTYYVWMQGRGPDGKSDSLFVGVDEATKVPLTGFQDTALTWVSAVQGEAGSRVAVDLGAGVNTLSVWVREPGVYFQRFLLTDNPTWQPITRPTGINTTTHATLDGRVYIVDTGQEVTLGWDPYDASGGAPAGFTVTVQSVERGADTVKRILPGADLVEYRFTLPRTGMWLVCVEAFNDEGNSEPACSSDPEYAQVEGAAGAWWISAKIASIPGGIETGE